MDWQSRMTRALAYLEAHLCDEMDLEEAARQANCSAFHFYRMFDVIAGISLGEYVRRRRLSEAAMALAAGQDKVIDVALRFGYDSPDAFARAFRREFGCLPSQARKSGIPLHSYPPLWFQIILRGDQPMEYRIEEGQAVGLAGISIRVSTKDGSNFKTVPGFWDTIMQDKRFEALAARADPKRLCVCGVCRDFDMDRGEFTYSIAVDRPADMAGMPEGSEVFTVPASTWAKFTSRGPLRPNLQEMVKRIFGEWLPASDWEHAGTAELEYYPEGDPRAQDYYCEYWIPLVKGKNR